MSISEACGVTRQFGRIVNGLQKLQEAADAFEHYEQAIVERTSRLESLDRKLEDRTAKLAELEAKATSAVTQAAATIEAANGKAGEIVNAARAEAEKILAAAKTDEQAARDRAGEAINRAIAAERELQTKSEALAEIEGKLETAEAERRKILAG